MYFKTNVYKYLNSYTNHIKNDKLINYYIRNIKNPDSKIIYSTDRYISLGHICIDENGQMGKRRLVTAFTANNKDDAEMTTANNLIKFWEVMDILNPYLTLMKCQFVQLDG